jgi:hypothetical protein
MSENAGRDTMSEELTALELREARVSAERARLHHQIDFGFGSEKTRARERQISDERRQLHLRINSLREVLKIFARSRRAGARSK